MSQAVQGQPETIYLKDYTPPAYTVDTIHLTVDLQPTTTRVTAKTVLSPNEGTAAGTPLSLHGEDQKLLSVTMNGNQVAADDYKVDAETLTLSAPQLNSDGKLELVIESEIAPQNNKALEGLYMSNGMYCTQCEAEGFRNITYYLDRPDVLAVFTTKIIADKATCPILLSNGNPVGAGDLPDGRHWAEWHDPFPKPSYLFALVAGNLVAVTDTFTTVSGREIDLRIYVEPGNEDRCDFAMESLKNSMAWDEKAYGREYDLDIFMIVAVADFNMGAMENKGLNIFNAKYILARSDTATDVDYSLIEGIIGHEYFHNWTGNRITCRDWFQLSLKEGLTVFRDQQFSSDMRSAPVKRIADVRNLRAGQFPEDSGPLAHPVQPKAYMEINNFYTATVYEKGAEVIRMMHTILGSEKFRKGTDLYFERHDGEAATVDDFVKSMEDASGVDLTQFRRWYDQSGTPEIVATDSFDSAAGTYDITFTQNHPETPDKQPKQDLHIPIDIALLSKKGDELPLTLEGDTAGTGEKNRVLSLTKKTQSFRFVGLTEEPVPSLFRGFSAPVNLTGDAADKNKQALMAFDKDPFSRWDAGQQFATQLLLDLADGAAGDEDRITDLVDAFGNALKDDTLDPAFVALMLSLPSEGELAQAATPVNVEGLHDARERVLSAIATSLQSDLERTYHRLTSNEPYSPDSASAGRRSLRNAALAYLSRLETAETNQLVANQYRHADNMTDKMAALALLADSKNPDRESALDDFCTAWKDDPVVIDKWLRIQAVTKSDGTLDTVKSLTDHPVFSWERPNRVYSLIGAFGFANHSQFHRADGAGYRFVEDAVLRLNKTNPQIAARIASIFESWRRYDEGRKKLARESLERIVNSENLSRNVFEIVSKTLNG